MYIQNSIKVCMCTEIKVRGYARIRIYVYTKFDGIRRNRVKNTQNRLFLAQK